MKNLGNIIVMYVISGWTMMKNHIIVQTVDFVAWEVKRTFATVMIVACV